MDCPGCPQKTPTFHRLWLAGEILPCGTVSNPTGETRSPLWKTQLANKKSSPPQLPPVSWLIFFREFHNTPGVCCGDTRWMVGHLKPPVSNNSMNKIFLNVLPLRQIWIFDVCDTIVFVLSVLISIWFVVHIRELKMPHTHFWSFVFTHLYPSLRRKTVLVYMKKFSVHSVLLHNQALS